ncbi:MAG: hypothetical protein KAF91_28750 [Nostoc sp. TH1S01]|nr:hypothetical protein [Nostoc sp. TH1S01]
MARRRRNSRTLEKAQVRLAGIKSISPTLDVGEGLTVQDYTEKIESLRNSIEAYNSALSDVDVLRTQILENEKTVADYSDKFLRGISYKYGNNSYEYQKAGGTRKSDRKRTTRQSMASPN